MNDSWFSTVNGMKSIRNNWDIMDGNTSEFMMVLLTNFAKYNNPTPWYLFRSLLLLFILFSFLALSYDTFK